MVPPATNAMFVGSAYLWGMVTYLAKIKQAQRKDG